MVLFLVSDKKNINLIDSTYDIQIEIEEVLSIKGLSKKSILGQISHITKLIVDISKLSENDEEISNIIGSVMSYNAQLEMCIVSSRLEGDMLLASLYNNAVYSFINTNASKEDIEKEIYNFLDGKTNRTTAVKYKQEKIILKEDKKKKNTFVLPNIKSIFKRKKKEKGEDIETEDIKIVNVEYTQSEPILESLEKIIEIEEIEEVKEKVREEVREEVKGEDVDLIISTINNKKVLMLNGKIIANNLAGTFFLKIAKDERIEDYILENGYNLSYESLDIFDEVQVQEKVQEKMQVQQIEEKEVQKKQVEENQAEEKEETQEERTTETERKVIVIKKESATLKDINIAKAKSLENNIDLFSTFKNHQNGDYYQKKEAIYIDKYSNILYCYGNKIGVLDGDDKSIVIDFNFKNDEVENWCNAKKYIFSYVHNMYDKLNE